MRRYRVHLFARARTIDDEIVGQVHECLHLVIESRLFLAFVAGVTLSLSARCSRPRRLSPRAMAGSIAGCSPVFSGVLLRVTCSNTSRHRLDASRAIGDER